MLTGHPKERLPGLASFLFDGVQGEPLVSALNEAGICASSGSACSAGSGEPSRVLKAAGVKTSQHAAPLRLSLSENNTAEEMNRILANMPAALIKAAADNVLPQGLNLDDI
jgi:cysteine desulfurase